MTDMEALEHQVRYLEAENRKLKQTLWDSFFIAALQSCPAKFGAATGVKVAAEVADKAVTLRNERMGVTS